MIYVSWAYTENQMKKRDENMSEYEKIKHLRSKEHMDFTGKASYACHEFSGTLLSDEAKALSNDQILLLMDTGNLCFGGKIRRNGDRFFGKYYTD